MKNRAMAALILIGLVLAALRPGGARADAIDDAEAKKRGVPVEVVQLESAKARITLLEAQLKQAAADLAKAQGDKVAVDKKAGDVADGQYPALDGVWQEGPEENHIQLTIVQKGDEFTADCTYQHPKVGEIRWQMKGNVSKDGEIRGRLIHIKAPPTWVNQTRVGVLSADGKREMFGALNEPSGDDWERTKKIALFNKITFERAMRAFDEARQNVRLHINANLRQPFCNPAPPVDETVEELKKLRNTAKKAKAAYDKALADVEAARPEEDKMYQRMNQENKNENEELLAAIEKIEL